MKVFDPRPGVDEVFLSGSLSALLLPVAIFLITRALASQLGP